MTRTPFLAGTAPREWLDTPRTGQSPAERAYAVERYSDKGKPASAVTAILWGLVALLGALLVVAVVARGMV
jgi:hypothetical protein